MSDMKTVKSELQKLRLERKWTSAKIEELSAAKKVLLTEIKEKDAELEALKAANKATAE